MATDAQPILPDTDLDEDNLLALIIRIFGTEDEFNGGWMFSMKRKPPSCSFLTATRYRPDFRPRLPQNRSRCTAARRARDRLCPTAT